MLYKPTRRELVLPLRFSPLSPSFASGPVTALEKDGVEKAWGEICGKAGRKIEGFLLITDMADALSGRMLAYRHQHIGYLEPLDARHVLPSLRTDGADFRLEGAHVLKEARLFPADELATTLLEELGALGVNVFAHGAIHLEADTIHLEKGGRLSFDRLIAADMGEGEEEAEWFQPVIGLKTALFNGASLMSEDFTALSLQRGEALFIGRRDQSRKELEDAILSLLPGLEGAEMSRSFFLPLPSLPSSGEIADLVAAEQERMAERALHLGVDSFGLKAILLAAEAIDDKPPLWDGERVRAWFAGSA